MKQRLSIGALAISLSWKPAVLVFLAVMGIQFGTFHLRMEEFDSFAMLTDELFALPGKLGAVALLIVLILAGCEFRGGKFSYTLRRLGVREQHVTLIWAAVFTGWFFLYWMAQLCVLFGCQARFAQGKELEPTALFLTTYLSEYFHLLFPLAERLGYLRNAVLCIGFGCNAAFAAHQVRHKGGAWAPVVLVLFYGIFARGDLAEWPTDIALILGTLIQVIICGATLRKGEGIDEN